MPQILEREERETQKVFQKFVMFGLGRERHAVPVLKVKEIISSGRVFPIPRMPPFIEGILSLRGEIIPIVDLRKRFELPEVPKTEESRIVVLEMGSFYVGISVDQVFEVIKIEEGKIEPPPPLVGGLRADFLEGVCELESHLVTILNLEQIFSLSERSLLAEAAGGTAEEKKTSASPAPAPSAGAGHDEVLGKWYEAVNVPAGAAPGKKATGSPPPSPAAAAAPSQEAVVGSDGRVRHGGRVLFLGSPLAGQTVRIESSGAEILVRRGEEIVKRFKS